MAKTVERRNFIKIIGGLSILAICNTNLLSCKKANEKEKHTKISFFALEDYNIVTTEEYSMLVKYKPKERSFTVVKLSTDNESLNEEEIFRTEIKEYDVNKVIFYNEFGVIKEDMALPYFKKYLGLKDYYTIDEIKYILETDQIENTNQKRLVK